MRNRQLVRFNRRFEEHKVRGYVLDVGPRFFLLALVSEVYGSMYLSASASRTCSFRSLLSYGHRLALVVSFSLLRALTTVGGFSTIRQESSFNGGI